MKRLTDHLPIALLAVIAFAGSFSHVSALARRSGQEGWMAFATAVCVDLLAVVAAEEIRRDKRMGRKATVPMLVLGIAIVLTLAANLAEAQPTVWGRICAGVPAGAFLLATMLLERRGSGDRIDEETVEEPEPVTVKPAVVPPPEPVVHPLKTAARRPTRKKAASAPKDLLESARKADHEHRERTGRRISRDALRTALGCSTGTATTVLRSLRAEQSPA